MTSIEVSTQAIEQFHTKSRNPRQKPYKVKYTTLIDGKPYGELCFDREYAVIVVNKRTKRGRLPFPGAVEGERMVFPLKGAVATMVEYCKWCAETIVQTRRAAVDRTALNMRATVEV